MTDTHNWANESQDTTAPVKRRMAPGTGEGRFSSDLAAEMTEIAASRIQSVWDDVGATDAQTLASNVVSAQEWLWLSMQHPTAAHDQKVRADTLEAAAHVVESCIGCFEEPLQECAKDGDEAAQFFGKMHAEQIRALTTPTQKEN